MVTIKCVLVGSLVAKKSEFLNRYTRKYFPEVYIPTVFENYPVTCMVNGNPYTVGFWDTVLAEDCDRLRPLSYPDTDIFLLCFSVGHPHSLEVAITKFIPEIRKYCPNTPYILVGTRTDLRNATGDTEEFTGNSENCFPSEFGPCIANIIGAVLYKECSSSSGDGVDDVVDSAVFAALHRKNDTLDQDSHSRYPVNMNSEWKKAAASTMKILVSRK